MKIRFDKKKS